MAAPPRSHNTHTAQEPARTPPPIPESQVKRISLEDWRKRQKQPPTLGTAGLRKLLASHPDKLARLKQVLHLKRNAHLRQAYASWNLEGLRRLGFSQADADRLIAIRDDLLNKPGKTKETAR